MYHTQALYRQRKQISTTRRHRKKFPGLLEQYITHPLYVVCPKSNASDFFAQPRTARKGKWVLRQVEEEPTYTVGPSSVESAPL
jgi:hypothetical protein